MDMDDIIELLDQWAVGTDFESVVQHQSETETPEVEQDGLALKVKWFEGSDRVPPRLMVMSYPAADQAVKIRILGNSRILDEGQAAKMLEKLCSAVQTLCLLPEEGS
jgi:hypothetical protein